MIAERVLSENVNGKPHRRPNYKRNRGNLDTCCPSAGHRRNPDIPAHPDFPVRIIYGYCLNDSPGTLGTISCAKRYKVNHDLLAIYS
jgi:hypothetical protein